MMYLSWLLVVVMAYVCVPGFGSVCWDRSQCNDLSNKGRILACIRLCMSAIQSEFPQLSAMDLKVNNNDDDLLLSVILATMVSENKISESDLKAHRDERRSYSMEHFRWGKPSGRKRRPVKVFASSLEGGGPSERSFPPQARRQLGSNNDEVRDLSGGSQRGKNASYRMSHFRWGSPPASKRSGSFMKKRMKKRQRQLDKLLRTIIVKDVQRIMG
ncbi:hypothetical protein VZT92_010980 [Zoarces viviparus]|uniref:Pro-opiomelanocortin/corticotropin ACTH central region domain-containing protein n=1 Tax=Zoarces viviparus TaxID=48416 RepID=A0AAW1F9N0_ZOAVI